MATRRGLTVTRCWMGVAPRGLLADVEVYIDWEEHVMVAWLPHSQSSRPCHGKYRVQGPLKSDAEGHLVV